VNSTLVTQIFSVFRDAKSQLEWCPSSPKPQGIARCIKLAHMSAANVLPPNHHEPHNSPPPVRVSQRASRSSMESPLSQRRQALPHLPSSSHPHDREAPPCHQRCRERLPPNLCYPSSPHDRPRLHRRIYCGADPQTVSHVIQHCPGLERAGAALHLIRN